MAEFHLDRDRGYTFAYTLIGWTLRKGYDAKSSWRDGLGEAMRRAEADHAFLRLECTADYSDQIVLGMQVQGGAEHHRNVQAALEALLASGHFPSSKGARL